MNIYKQSGLVMIEYLLMGVVLALLWVSIDFVMEQFGEHQNEYTHSIAQP